MTKSSITDLPERIRDQEFWLKLGSPVNEAFPSLGKLHRADQFRDPLRALLSFTNWAWLQCHAGISATEIVRAGTSVVERDLEVYSVARRDSWRTQHDFLLLSVGILLNNSRLTQRICEIAEHAQKDSNQNVFWAACAGMLKFKILGDQQKQREQFELYAACKGKPPQIRIAKRTTIAAFIDADIKKVRYGASAAAKMFQGRLFKIQRDPMKRDFEFRVIWPTNEFWPWPEAVLLKLTSSSPGEREIDDFWLPPTLLNV